MFTRFLQDETGLELSEYAVAAAIIAVGIVATFASLGSVIEERITILKNFVANS